MRMLIPLAIVVLVGCAKPTPPPRLSLSIANDSVKACVVGTTDCISTTYASLRPWICATPAAP